MCCENLRKDQGIFPKVIILLIFTTLSLDNVWILLGGNWCWTPLGLKGLMKFRKMQTSGNLKSETVSLAVPLMYRIRWYIELGSAKSEAPFNIYRFHKENIKSSNT